MFQRVLSSSDFCSKIGNFWESRIIHMDSFFSCTALNFVEFVHFLKYVPVEVVIAQFFFLSKEI